MTSQGTIRRGSNKRKVMITGAPLYIGQRLCYTNEDSQGLAIRHTSEFPYELKVSEKYHNIDLYGNCCSTDQKVLWTKDLPVPDGLEIDSDWVDHMYWPQDRWTAFVSTLAQRLTHQQMMLNDLFINCNEEHLLQAVSQFFDTEVKAVRVVYYFNVASGYDCQRIDFLHTGFNNQ